jgi:hypothetical protein
LFARLISSCSPGTGDGQLSLTEAVTSWILSVGIQSAGIRSDLAKFAGCVPAIPSVPILGMLGIFLGFDIFIEAFPRGISKKRNDRE